MDFALFKAMTLGEMEFFDASIDVPFAPNIPRILPFKLPSEHSTYSCEYPQIGKHAFFV